MRRNRNYLNLNQRYQHHGASSFLESNQLGSNYSMQPESLVRNVSNFSNEYVRDEINDRFMMNLFHKNNI